MNNAIDPTNAGGAPQTIPVFDVVRDSFMNARKAVDKQNLNCNDFPECVLILQQVPVQIVFTIADGCFKAAEDAMGEGLAVEPRHDRNIAMMISSVFEFQMQQMQRAQSRLVESQEKLRQGLIGT